MTALLVYAALAAPVALGLAWLVFNLMNPD